MHTRILVTLTIEAQGSMDLDVPGDIVVQALIPALLEVGGIQLTPHQLKGQNEWGLGLQDSSHPFDTAITLVDAGVLDGAELILQHGQTWGTQSRPLFTPKTILPQPGGISITWDREGLRS